MEAFAVEEAQAGQQQRRKCGPLPAKRVLLAYAACLVAGAAIGAGLTVLIQKLCGGRLHNLGYDILSEGELTAYNKLLVMVTDGLKEKAVPWWLTDGTLLGATRNNPPGQIRWDDDMDIGFKNDHKKAVEEVLAGLGPDGEAKIEWQVLGDFFQVKLAGQDMKKQYYLDIFPLELRTDRGDKPAYYHFGTAYNWFPDTRYFPDEVEDQNLETCDFNGEKMQCPKNKANIMKRQFGHDALTTAVVFGFHEQGGQKKITFSLDEDVNRHMGLLPALDRKLLQRLVFTASQDSATK